jgi:transcriptional regulator with XRE-family HTH domain
MKGVYQMSESFSKRLKEAMRIRNMNQAELSQKSGISKSSLSEYLKGKYEAKQTGLFNLAKALDVNEVWLMGEDVPMDRSYGRSKVTEIPVINLSTNEVIQKIPYIYRTDVKDICIENIFAIYANDSSMAPLLDNGDIAIIQKQNSFISGGTYLLKIKKGYPIIRKVIQTTTDIELQAMNMWNYPTQTDLKNTDIEILGKVIKVENQSAFK